MPDDSIEKTPKEKEKKEAVEGFLHDIDPDRVLYETGLDMNGLCNLLGIDSQSVGRWEKKKENSGNRPKYNNLIRLLRAGATTKTLFGVDCEPRKNEAPTLEFLNSPAFMEGLREQLIKDFKEKGLMLEGNVRELIRQEIERLSNEKSDEKI